MDSNSGMISATEEDLLRAVKVAADGPAVEPPKELPPVIPPQPIRLHPVRKPLRDPMDP